MRRNESSIRIIKNEPAAINPYATSPKIKVKKEPSTINPYAASLKINQTLSFASDSSEDRKLLASTFVPSVQTVKGGTKSKRPDQVTTR